MDHFRKPAVSPETALASDIFDKFCAATTLKSILGYHRHLCELLHIKPTNFPQFYPRLKTKLKSWKAQALWNKFDKKASHKCYNRGLACPNTRVLIIGAGPCGLRAAIEAQLLGAKVVVIEKRDRISRNNVLHLWPFVIQDLRALGAKKFFGRFCAGSIDHISIRQLQCILLKVALIFGVEIHEGVGFESLLPPPSNQLEERIGWRAVVSPPEHPVSQYEFDVLMGADGKRNTLEGFERKEFRGKLAIAITANFINKRTRAEARVAEISGVAFIFNQKFFKDLYAETGIDLENIVYYKDDTHYFVMTAKKSSLINKGVILNDHSDTAKLLAPENVDKNALMEYAKEAADFSTNYKLPTLEFAVNYFGQPDVAMFDFTSMYAAVNASRVVEAKGHKLLMTLVGDSLLEPFWPTGSGCARGFLSSMDACWAVRNWGSGLMNTLEVLAERESIYRILGQTTPENLNRDFSSYTLDPHTRYPNLNSRAVLPVQVKNLYATDEPANLELCLKAPSNSSHLEQPKKRRRKDSQVHPDTLLQWLKRQVVLLNDVHITDFTTSFKDGRALCAIIYRYRPDLIDFHLLRPQDIAKNNQLAFDILERELGIPPVMTGQRMEECEVPDKLTMLSYLSQVYDMFRGEIPHIKHPKLDELNTSSREEISTSRIKAASKATLVNFLAHQNSRQSPSSRVSDHLNLPRKRHITSPNANETNNVTPRHRKRRSGVVPGTVAAKTQSLEDHKKRVAIQEEIMENRQERQSKRRMMRMITTQRLYKSMQMLQANAKGDDEDSVPFEDYSIFLYRQSAPDFKDRVKEMENKILYSDRDPHFVSGAKKGAAVKDFDGRIKNIEDKLKGINSATDKKPKDLLRAIGKIEKTDWNIKEIEKKIEESKWGKTTKQQRVEKVPKWSRQQFVDKFSAVERKLLRKDMDDETAKKYAEIDLSLKKLTQKIKDGNNLEQGERGANKVSAMAAQLAKAVEPEKSALQKSNSKAALAVPAGSGASELCHFCNKRVYLMERLSAEGRFFHRGCFRCEYCSITLRLGNYAFDRDGKYGNRFFCPQHFGMSGTQQKRYHRKKSEELRNLANKENILKSSNAAPKTPEVVKLEKDTLDRGGTPERIEFENLDLDNEEDGDAIPSEMDEDEWTDRNFGASTGEMGSSDELSDLTDSEEDSEDDNEEFAEALNVPLNADETLKLAEDWTRRYSNQKSGRQSVPSADDAKEEDNDNDSESVHESEDSQGRYSSQEYDSEVRSRLTSAEKCRLQNDESETQTEGEEELKAREIRKQEVRLEATGRMSESDTEVMFHSPFDSSYYNSPSSLSLLSTSDYQKSLDFLKCNDKKYSLPYRFVRSKSKMSRANSLVSFNYDRQINDDSTSDVLKGSLSLPTLIIPIHDGIHLSCSALAPKVLVSGAESEKSGLEIISSNDVEVGKNVGSHKDSSGRSSSLSIQDSKKASQKNAYIDSSLENLSSKSPSLKGAVKKNKKLKKSNLSLSDAKDENQVPSPASGGAALFLSKLSNISKPAQTNIRSKSTSENSTPSLSPQLRRKISEPLRGSKNSGRTTSENSTSSLSPQLNLLRKSSENLRNTKSSTKSIPSSISPSFCVTPTESPTLDRKVSIVRQFLNKSDSTDTKNSNCGNQGMLKKSSSMQAMSISNISFTSDGISISKKLSMPNAASQNLPTSVKNTEISKPVVPKARPKLSEEEKKLLIKTFLSSKMGTSSTSSQQSSKEVKDEKNPVNKGVVKAPAPKAGKKNFSQNNLFKSSNSFLKDTIEASDLPGKENKGSKQTGPGSGKKSKKFSRKNSSPKGSVERNILAESQEPQGKPKGQSIKTKSLTPELSRKEYQKSNVQNFLRGKAPSESTSPLSVLKLQFSPKVNELKQKFLGSNNSKVTPVEPSHASPSPPNVSKYPKPSSFNRIPIQKSATAASIKILDRSNFDLLTGDSSNLTDDKKRTLSSKKLKSSNDSNTDSPKIIKSGPVIIPKIFSKTNSSALLEPSPKPSLKKTTLMLQPVRNTSLTIENRSSDEVKISEHPLKLMHSKSTSHIVSKPLKVTSEMYPKSPKPLSVPSVKSVTSLISELNKKSVSSVPSTKTPPSKPSPSPERQSNVLTASLQLQPQTNDYQKKFEEPSSFNDCFVPPPRRAKVKVSVTESKATPSTASIPPSPQTNKKSTSEKSKNDCSLM